MRNVLIGLTAAVLLVGGAVTWGKALSADRVQPAQVSSALDGCDQFWVMQSAEGKNPRTLRLEVRALSRAIEPYDRELASSLLLLAGARDPFVKSDDFIYRRCVEVHDWPPPTPEIANLNENSGSN